MKRIFIAAAVLILAITNFSSAQDYPTHVQLTEDEKTEAVQFAKDFFEKIHSGYDFGPVVDQMFVSDLLRRYLSEKEKSSPIREYMDYGLAKKITEADFKRFYVARQNIFFIGFVYGCSKFDIDSADADREYEDGYPQEMLDELKKDPLVRKALNSDTRPSTVRFFRAELAATERAVIVGRQLLARRTAKEIERYQKSLEIIRKRAEKYDSPSGPLWRPSGTISRTVHLGFPIGTRFVSIDTPFLALYMVKVDGKLKILGVGL